MSTKTKEKERKLFFTHYDSKGNVIEDLSKIVIPRERQLKLLNEINRGRGIERR
jgi:hypothetical protein